MPRLLNRFYIARDTQEHTDRWALHDRHKPMVSDCVAFFDHRDEARVWCKLANDPDCEISWQNGKIIGIHALGVYDEATHTLRTGKDVL